MGLPYHLPAPLQAFESIAHVTRPQGLMVLESAGLNTTENEYFVIDERGDVLKLFPIVNAIRRALDHYGEIVEEVLPQKSGEFSRVVFHTNVRKSRMISSAGGFE